MFNICSETCFTRRIAFHLVAHSWHMVILANGHNVSKALRKTVVTALYSFTDTVVLHSVFSMLGVCWNWDYSVLEACKFVLTRDKPVLANSCVKHVVQISLTFQTFLGALGEEKRRILLKRPFCRKLICWILNVCRNMDAMFYGYCCS